MHAADQAGVDLVDGSRHEVRLERAAEVEPGRETGQEPVDRQHRQLVVGELDHVRQHEVVGSGPANRPSLVAVGQRRLEAMVTVGDDDRSARHERADLTLQGGLVDDPQGMGHTVVVGPARDGRTTEVQEIRQAACRREAPDRRELDPGGTQQLQPVALGLGGGVLVRQDPALAGGAQLQRSQHPRGVVVMPGFVDEIHPVDEEARLRVLDEDAVVAPVVEARRRGRVGVTLVAAREVDGDDVLGVTGEQCGPVVVVDDVVGRGRHLRDLDPVEVEA